MRIGVIDPTLDPRWRAFVQRHPAGGIFHSPEWLTALRRAYGYKPVAYVGFDGGGEITTGIPFCDVRSVVTGHRLISLPFSDHCQPLTANAHELNELLSTIQDDVRRQRLKYLEIRPLVAQDVPSRDGGLKQSGAALLHRLDLSHGEQAILDRCHKSRRQTRSQQGTLHFEDGRSDSLLERFYRLLLLTRRRQRIPPQPFAWFKHLRDCLGNAMSIWIASKNGIPVASIVTLFFKNGVTYKYSCSDSAYNAERGTVHLIWRIIQDAIAHGATELDLGRSDLDNLGLISFKGRWGATQSALIYYRYPEGGRGPLHQPILASSAKWLLTKIPNSMFTALGGLYRHVG
jgi:CelD/BcsL family acetyltransferase involved in cellulose biosynthesis